MNECQICFKPVSAGIRNKWFFQKKVWDNQLQCCRKVVCQTCMKKYTKVSKNNVILWIKCPFCRVEMDDQMLASLVPKKRMNKIKKYRSEFNHLKENPEMGYIICNRCKKCFSKKRSQMTEDNYNQLCSTCVKSEKNVIHCQICDNYLNLNSPAKDQTNSTIKFVFKSTVLPPQFRTYNFTSCHCNTVYCGQCHQVVPDCSTHFCPKICTKCDHCGLYTRSMINHQCPEVCDQCNDPKCENNILYKCAECLFIYGIKKINDHNCNFCKPEMIEVSGPEGKKV